ncbi:hypothetical protein BDQ12DRAFT_726964 [Crucibulum laeve]|uniref:Uncharacterized protein n=1 Tax=Crucibulum laeve TaxID=68775 RepID=A0A5C3LNE6_9AGAR|nr:hypothetical protein BDQ12DRAFT_726964 [Crucibulum laeve]
MHRLPSSTNILTNTVLTSAACISIAEAANYPRQDVCPGCKAIVGSVCKELVARGAFFEVEEPSNQFRDGEFGSGGGGLRGREEAFGGDPPASPSADSEEVGIESLNNVDIDVNGVVDVDSGTGCLDEDADKSDTETTSLPPADARDVAANVGGADNGGGSLIARSDEVGSSEDAG